MTRRDLLALTGNMEQVAGVRLVEYEEGRASGLRAFEVHNGPMRFTVLADKCLDIGEFSYNGIGFSFLSKPGIQNRQAYDTRGLEAQRGIMGGFMFTAGLENIGAPCTIDGREYPMHGRLRSTPAENLSGDARWDDDTFVLEVSGDIREAELFGENFLVHRRIVSNFGEKSFTITDTITNEAFRTEPYLILYHINMGYPLLAPGTKIYAPTRGVTPRDKEASGHENEWNMFGQPLPNEPEYVFFHNLQTAPDGLGIASVINESLGLGIRITFTASTLPVFTEWKSLASGDYALGLEPSNASVLGRVHGVREGSLKTLEPMESVTNVLTFTVLDGQDEIRKAKDEAESILSA